MVSGIYVFFFLIRDYQETVAPLDLLARQEPRCVVSPNLESAIPVEFDCLYFIPVTDAY